MAARSSGGVLQTHLNVLSRLGAIGEGPSRVEYDMTDGQPFALIRIATVQHKAGDIAGAIATLRDAFRSVDEHPKMRGRDGRYLQVALAQIENGDIEGAARSIDAMENHRHEPLAALARAYAAAGDDRAARATFARALADLGGPVLNPPGVPPPIAIAKTPAVQPDNTAGVRMDLAEIQAIAGDVPAALKTVRSIDNPNSQVFALVKVVSARATAGDVAGVLRLALDESRTPDERRSALEGLARGLDTRLSLRLPVRRGDK